MCQEVFGVVVDRSCLAKGGELAEGVASCRGTKALVDAPSEIHPVHHCLVFASGACTSAARHLLDGKMHTRLALFQESSDL